MNSGRVSPFAAIQATPVPGDVLGNAALGAALVARAADEGARVAVLPELFLSAYHPPTLYGTTRADVRADADRRVADDRLEPLLAAAHAGDVVVVVGARGQSGRRPAYLFGAGGQAGRGCARRVRQARTCGAPTSGRCSSRVRRRAAISVDGWRLGLGICYDGCFPEHARAKPPWPAPRRTACARPVTWSAPNTAATSTTGRGPWTTRCTWCSPTRSGMARPVGRSTAARPCTSRRAGSWCGPATTARRW